MAAPECAPARRQGSAALAALTAAALALPGMACAQVAPADGNEATFDYQHYEEGQRNLDGQSYHDLNLKPLRVDSLAAGATGPLSDRVTFGFHYTQDTWSGATPVATLPQAAIADQIYSGASRPTSYSTDPQGNPVDVNWPTYDGNTVQYANDSRLVHVMGSASPETRRQGDATLGYEWNNAAVTLNGGVSVEPDYFSSFGSIDGRLDLNHKLTTLDWSFGYTASDIHASLEADTAADWGAYTGQIQDNGAGVQTLYGHRQDVAVGFGVTQVLNKDAVLSASVGYTRSIGYLSNPYKAVIFAFNDPDQFIDSTGLRTVVLQGVLDKRPTERNQWTWDMRLVQYLNRFDAALHLDDRVYHDDWGVNALTLDASWYQPLGHGWMVTPGVRYYTQTRARFYQPYFLFQEAYPILPPFNPDVPRKLDFSRVPIGNYSSDERLSGFGTLSGRLALSKRFARGFTFEIGGEFDRHAGSLKLGGGGEGAYADFNSYTLYTTLKVDLSARSLAGGAGGSGQAHAAQDGFEAPAGVQADSLLDKAGQVSVGVRYDYSRRGGDILRGSSPADDQSIIDHGCGDVSCQLAPVIGSDHVSVLELKYAATDWLTLMVAPELVDIHLDVRPLVPAFLPASGLLGPGFSPPPNYKHTTGGLGDTGVYALVRLLDTDGLRLHAGVGVSAPTGNASVRISGGTDYVSYPLQLGAGVWTFRPSLTLKGRMERWSWGGQVSGAVKLQSLNGDGYGPGNSFQATAWGGYRFLDWLSGSVRAVRSWQGATSGGYSPHLVPQITDYKYVGDEVVAIYQDVPTPATVNGPMDMPASQGGHYWDIGVGLSAVVPSGPLAGNRLGIEWLQPLHDQVHGYQLARTGTLSVSWSLRL